MQSYVGDTVKRSVSSSGLKDIIDSKYNSTR